MRAPAIALSGYVAEGDRENSLAAGFNFHFNKPLDIFSLIEVVTRLVHE